MGKYQVYAVLVEQASNKSYFICQVILLHITTLHIITVSGDDSQNQLKTKSASLYQLSQVQLNIQTV